MQNSSQIQSDGRTRQKRARESSKTKSGTNAVVDLLHDSIGKFSDVCPEILLRDDSDVDTRNENCR
jgi:hypothetical protein